MMRDPGVENDKDGNLILLSSMPRVVATGNVRCAREE